MIALQPADLVLIASRTLNLGTEATLDLVNLQAAQAALAEAAPEITGGTEDPARAAAALLHALVHHPLVPHGAEQVALVATAQFLALNGFQIDLDPPETTRTVIADLTAGRLDPVDLADWLAPRLRPQDGQPSCGRSPSLLSWLPIRRHRRLTSANDPFHRYTDRARTVMVLAQEEARRLGHDYLGTEHLLLGLLGVKQGVAAKTLQMLGITSDAVRHQVEQIIGPGHEAPRGHVPITPRAKRTMLEYAMREALQLGHNYVGTEHLLLGLLREGTGVAATVLVNLGANHDQTREQVLQLLTRAHTQRTEEPPELRHYTEQIIRVRRDKNAAIDRGDLGTAAELRDLEERLLSEQRDAAKHLAANDDKRPPAAQAGP